MKFPTAPIPGVAAVSHRRIRRAVIALLLPAVGLGSGTAWAADNFPSRPIKIIVPFAAGGSTDALARVVAQQLQEKLGQPVTIDNRPGAAGAIGADAVAKSPADGYTLLMATSSTHAVLPHLRKLPYDPVADFTPVAEIGTAPNVLVVSPVLGVDNIAQLLKLQKTRSGELSFSSSGSGTITHLISEAFAQAAGIKATHVPYKTGVQALPDIAGGQVDFAFDSIVWTLPQAKAGKLKALAISSTKRSALAPDLPTVAESGFPGFDGTTWFGFMGPKGLPAPVVAELNAQINRILASANVRSLFEAQGAEPTPVSPSAFAQMVKADGERWSQVIRKGNIKLND
ncbi:MAG: tripartite tricarboxylate transporter substrate binding protein [Pseudomonadota bacterium]